MLAALDLQDDTETPEECIIDLLVSTRTELDTLRLLCAPKISDDLQLERSSELIPGDLGEHVQLQERWAKNTGRGPESCEARDNQWSGSGQVFRGG